MLSFDSTARGVIAGIGHGTTKDGPGWRSIVYFKGCNFRCGWCGSPETSNFRNELLLYPGMEKYPGRAVASCPKGAVTVSGDRGATETNRSICNNCETIECADACIDGSRERTGRLVTIDDVLAEILPYRRFHSEYGVTLSGGEVTCQWIFFLELLKAFKSNGLHTAAETNGSFDLFPDSLPWLDLAVIDLKHPDPKRHAALTGFSNNVVLENIRIAAGRGKELWVRIPLLPGINDGPDLDASAALLAPLKEKIKIEILGYHRIGVPKWAALGREYNFHRLEPPDEAQIETARALFRGKGFNIIVT